MATSAAATSGPHDAVNVTAVGYNLRLVLAAAQANANASHPSPSGLCRRPIRTAD